MGKNDIIIQWAMQEPIWFPVNRTLMTRLVRSERERDLSHSKSTSRTCSGVCPSMNKFLWLECWLPIASTDSAATVLLTKSHVCCFRNISKNYILELNSTEKCKENMFHLEFQDSDQNKSSQELWCIRGAHECHRNLMFHCEFWMKYYPQAKQ